MKRFPVKNVKKDKREFRKTAVKSKRMNVDAPTFRGGIRL